MDQSADWRRAFHGVRKPGVERHLRGLAHGTDEQQDADHVIPVKQFEAPGAPGQLLRVGPRATAKHGDDAEQYGGGVALNNEHGSRF